MCLPITPGGNHGPGHFYLAKNRTFLLCVDTNDTNDTNAEMHPYFPLLLHRTNPS
jgi:hypothetical protein